MAVRVGGKEGPQRENTIRIEPVFLFDLDGTLVDSVYQHVLAWNVSRDTRSSWRSASFSAANVGPKSA